MITDLRLFFFFCILLFASVAAIAQDTTSVPEEPETEFVDRAFWTTRVINGHSLENLGFGELDFKISHRMGRLTSGPKELFGLHQATSQIGVEYGVFDRLMVGIATTVVQKIYMGFFKFKLLRQSTGKRKIPVTVSYFANMEVNTADQAYPEGQSYFSSRLYYTHQLLIGSKIFERLTVQVTPTLVHRNMVISKRDNNNVFSAGFSGHLKISRKLAITAEYFYVLPNQVYSNFGGAQVNNSFSVGMDIFTGRHVFQLFLTNSTAMDEKSFITETTGQWNKKEFRIGFNISRVFTIVNKDE